jgi:hypothetical protein
MPRQAQQGSGRRAVVARHIVFSVCSIFAVAALCAAPMATADSSSADQIKPLALLESRNYAEVERHYAARQKAYEDGAIPDETLYKDFRALYKDSAANEQYFTGWVSAFPKSYSARMARGTYYYRMGWFVRGNQYFSQIPQDQRAQMHDYLAKARADLNASLKMTGRPYLSTLYLLNVAMLSGKASERRHWLDVGTKLDPKNIMLRTRYMITLEPRWGGSLEEMEAFLEECERQKLPERSLARLEHIILQEVADTLSDNSPASERYEIWSEVRRAEDEAGLPPSVEAVMRLTRAAWDLNKHDEANRGLEQLFRMNVEEGWVLSQMAWILGHQGRHKEGWPLLLKAAEQKNPWAQFVAGKTIYRGSANLGVVADQNAGLELIRRAAAQKNTDAQAFLKSLN